MARPPHRSTAVAIISAALLTALLAAPVAAAPNALSSPSVTPATGTTETPITFSVHYSSGQAAAPNWVRAIVSGIAAPISLSLFSGSAADGTYRATTTLPVGTRSVTFRADAPQGLDPVISGGTVSISDPGSPTPSQGPTATPNPSPTTAPTPTASPTSSPSPTAIATGSPAPTTTATSGASPSPPGSSGTSAPQPTPGGVLAGRPSSTPSTAPAPGALASGTARPTAVAVGVPRPSVSPGVPAPDEAPDSIEAGRSGIPAAAFWLLAGGAISVSGAATLGVLALRHRARMRAN